MGKDTRLWIDICSIDTLFMDEHTIYTFIFHGKNLLQTLQVLIYHTQREITT